MSITFYPSLSPSWLVQSQWFSWIFFHSFTVNHASVWAILIFFCSILLYNMLHFHFHVTSIAIYQTTSYTVCRRLSWHTTILAALRYGRPSIQLTMKCYSCGWNRTLGCIMWCGLWPVNCVHIWPIVSSFWSWVALRLLCLYNWCAAGLHCGIASVHGLHSTNQWHDWIL